VGNCCARQGQRQNFCKSKLLRYNQTVGIKYRTLYRVESPRLKAGRIAGSIPEGVIRMFHWHNPSSCTMALGLTQHLTEMSTRNISWGDKGGRCVGADKLTTFMCGLFGNLGSLILQGLSKF